jgi:hypothetical protein
MLTSKAIQFGENKEVVLKMDQILLTTGVVGSSSKTVTTPDTNHLAIDLVETSTLEKDKVIKIYEGRVKSFRCYETMIEGLFKTFPRKSGSKENFLMRFGGLC